MADGIDVAARRPLILCGDPELLDELLGICLAAAVEAEVSADPSASWGAWTRSPIVLVGHDLAHRVGRAVGVGRLTRRPDAILVTRRAHSTDPALLACGIEWGASEVRAMPGDASLLVDRVIAAVEGNGRAGTVVGIVGGKGGAGASTLCAALAVAALRRDAVPALLDADPLSGGMDLVLDFGAPGLRWSELLGEPGRIPAAALRVSSGRSPTVVSWGRGSDDEGVVRRGWPPGSWSGVVDCARRACDVVILDLPRRWDVLGAVVGAVPSVLVVVPADVAGCAAAARVCAELRQAVQQVSLVVRGPGPLATTHIGDALAMPVAASLRSESSVASAWERGEPPGRNPGALARCADRLLDDLLPAGWTAAERVAG